VNKLRWHTGVFGGVLALVAVWGVFQYDGPVASFLFAALVGVLVVLAPYAVAYAKLLRERRRQRRLDESIYASPVLDVDRETFLDTSASALEAADAFVEVKRREFREGTGLIVDHTRFHGTFVRFTETGRAVVTGIKNDATNTVVDVLEDVWSNTLSRQASNPFLRPLPIRGLPRAMLTVGLTIVILLDAGFIAGVAYPAPAYNSGERVALVALDVRADVDPDTDEVDARLSKAAFLVTILEEEATEVRWQAGINDSNRASVNDAAAVSADVTRLLDAAAARDPSPEQRTRIEALRTAQGEALADVQRAMEEPAPTTTPPNIDAPFGLLDSTDTANSTNTTTATSTATATGT
jgi:hypothetical protein